MTSSDLAVATANANATEDESVRSWLIRMEPEIAKQLAGTIDTGAFARAALSSIRQSPGLQHAFDTPQGQASILGSIMLAAQLHLEIGPALGHFYLTPRQIGRDDAKHYECVPIIGYKGYNELAFRTGQIEKIETFLIREGDRFVKGANSERGQFFDWEPLDNENTRPWERVLACVKLKGATSVIWTDLTRGQVDARKPAYWRSTPWATNEDEMARKTAIRALAPYMPLTNALGQALEADERRVDKVDGVEGLVIREVTEPADEA